MFENEIAKLVTKLARQTEKVKNTTDVLDTLRAANLPKATLDAWTTRLQRQTAARDATQTTINVLEKHNKTGNSKSK